MLLTSAVWAYLFVVTLGLGLLLSRFIFNDRITLLEASLTGTVGLIALLQFWALAAPVGVSAALVVTALALFGLLTRRTLLVRPAFDGQTALLLLLVCGLSLWYSTMTLRDWDAGVYHLQSIEWARQFGVVPGVANLNSRLGFTSSAHLLVAFVPVGSAYSAAGSFLFALFAALAVLRTNAPDPRSRILAAVTAVFALYFLRVWAASPGTDLFAAALSGSALLLLASAEPSSSRRYDRLIVLLAIAAVTVKLSALPVLLVPTFLLAQQRTDRRFVLVSVAGAALLVLPWLIRSYILSGYPVYPVALELGAADWKLPLGLVRAESDAVAAFPWQTIQPPARLPRLFGLPPHPFWVSNSHFILIVLAALAPIALSADAIVRRRAVHWVEVGLVATAWAALAFLAAFGANPRFAYGVLIPAAAFSCALVVARLPRQLVGPVPLRLAVALAALLFYRQPAYYSTYDVPEREWRERLLAPARVPVAQGRVASLQGVPVFVADRLCWAQRPPCAQRPVHARPRGRQAKDGFRYQ